MNIEKLMLMKELITYYELLEIEQPDATVKKLNVHVKKLEKKLKEML